MREGLPAHGTSEQFPPRVVQLVLPKRLVLGEPFPAHGAAEGFLERLVGVSLHVAPQRKLVQPFPADGAAALLPGVDLHVLQQKRPVAETFLTDRTREAFLFHATIDWRGQMGRHSESGVGAAEGFLICVDPHVTGELSSPRKRSVTNRAAETSFSVTRRVSGNVFLISPP